MPTTYTEWSTVPSINIQRDVEVELNALLFNYPTLGKFITMSGQPAKNHKHEWTEFEQQQTVATLTADITSHAALATGITITVNDSAVFIVGDQVDIETFDPVYQVTAIPTGTTLTVKEIANYALGTTRGTGLTAKRNTSVTELSDYDGYNDLIFNFSNGGGEIRIDPGYQHRASRFFLPRNVQEKNNC